MSIFQPFLIASSFVTCFIYSSFHFPQRAKLTKSTPMTTELFFEWKRKRTEEIEAGLAAQRAERAKNDRMRYSSPVYPHLIRWLICDESFLLKNGLKQHDAE